MNNTIESNLNRFSGKDSYSYLNDPMHLLRRARIVELVCAAAKNLKSISLAEVGVGEGTLVRDYRALLSKLGVKLKIIGVELSDKLLTDLRKEGLIEEGFVGVAEKLPLAEDSQDIIVMSEVLEHLRTPIIGLKEIYRVLKKEGTFIGSVPNSGQIWDILKMIFGLAPNQLQRKIFDSTFTHESHFTYGLLKKALKETGFRDVKLTTNFVRLLPRGNTRVPFLNAIFNNLLPRFGDRLIWTCKK